MSCHTPHLAFFSKSICVCLMPTYILAEGRGRSREWWGGICKEKRRRRVLFRGTRLEFGPYWGLGWWVLLSDNRLFWLNLLLFFFFKSLLLRMLWLHCNDVTGSERVCMKQSWSWYALFSSHIKYMFIKQGLVCRETVGEGSRSGERTEVCWMPVYLTSMYLGKSQPCRKVKRVGSGSTCLELYPSRVLPHTAGCTWAYYLTSLYLSFSFYKRGTVDHLSYV